MTRLRLLLGRLTVPEEDEPPPARRSRRDWIVDSALFLVAAVFGTAAAPEQRPARAARPAARRRRDRRRGALPRPVVAAALAVELGLVSLPVLAVSSSAGPAGVVILYTVAAYRRWQLAVLVAAAQVALLPVGRALHPQGDSPGGVLPRRRRSARR